MFKNYPILKKIAPLFFLLFSFTIFSQTFTTSSTFTVPCGVTSITVEAWGGGGKGGQRGGSDGAAGGGGGGAYSRSVLTVISGQTYDVFVGAGSTSTAAGGNSRFRLQPAGTDLVRAAGGQSVANNSTSGVLGGAALTGIGDVTFNGGRGANVSSGNGGGGGSSAGTASIGNNGSASTGGAAPLGGGAGGNGSTSNDVAGSPGNFPGGGGGGAKRNNGTIAGGLGGNGQIIITYTSPFPTYCLPTFTSGVEPITNVTFAEINRTTLATGGSSLESFCDIGTVVRGSTSNPIYLKGNTAGNYTDHFRVYIDWNQDGDFLDLGESFYIGTIFNSTGTDPIILTGNIDVPATATLGNTRMRVMKRWNADPTNPCQTGSGYGQAEDYTINIICPTNTWSGNYSTDWNAASNWSCGEVPSISSDVLIPFPLASGNFPTLSVGDPSGLVKDIEIQNGASISIEGVINILTGTGTGNSLTITGNLTLNGKIDLEGESQLLQDTGSVLDAASTGTIEIDQQGEGNKFRYNYWSMPVYTANDGNNYTTIATSLKNGTVPSSPGLITYNNSGYDGATSPFTLSTYWMYKYANSGNGYSAWNQVRSTGPVYSGQGFTMKGPGDPGSPQQNYTFVGKPNNGTINLTVAANYDYLVGNPYPSAIDAIQFIWDNATSINGAIYFWEHYGGDTHNLAGYQGGYATYSLSGGVQASAFPGLGGGISVKLAPKRYIPVGQAFFVVGEAVDGGQIQFNNGQRVFEKESDGNSIFMKNSNTKAKTENTDGADLRPKFRIGFDAPKISHRQLLLTIDEKATKLVDWGFDAEIYEVFADDMYWMLNNKKYVIQGTNNVVLNSEVPLGMQLSKTGMVTVKIDALENVDEDTSIYLKDKVTGESFNMREKSVEINLVAGKYADRFVLIFKTQKLLAEDVKAELLIPATAQPIIEGIHVFMNNAVGELQIKNNSTEEITSVALINAVGQTVKTWNSNFNIRTISLPISTATGIYLVQINTKTGKTVKKISVE